MEQYLLFDAAALVGAKRSRIAWWLCAGDVCDKVECLVSCKAGSGSELLCL